MFARNPESLRLMYVEIGKGFLLLYTQSAPKDTENPKLHLPTPILKVALDCKEDMFF